MISDCIFRSIELVREVIAGGFQVALLLGGQEEARVQCPWRAKDCEAQGTLPLERKRPKGGGRQERKGHPAWLQGRTENPRGVLAGAGASQVRKGSCFEPSDSLNQNPGPY